MEESKTRDKILKKVRQALNNKSTYEPGNIDFDSQIFTASEEPLEMQFAERILALNGKFFFCENENEFMMNFNELVKENKWEQIFCFEPVIKPLLEKAKISFNEN